MNTTDSTTSEESEPMIEVVSYKFGVTIPPCPVSYVLGVTPAILITSMSLSDEGELSFEVKAFGLDELTIPMLACIGEALTQTDIEATPC